MMPVVAAPAHRATCHIHLCALDDKRASMRLSGYFVARHLLLVNQCKYIGRNLVCQVTAAEMDGRSAESLLE
jgi:hypothetical protein